MRVASSSPETRLPDWNRPEWFWRFVAPVVMSVTACYASLRVEGLEHLPRTGPALLVANHISGFDPLVLIRTGLRGGRRPRFLASAWLFTHPFAGVFLRGARMVPVRRGAGMQALADDAAAAFAAGQVVVVYPEGGIPHPDKRLTRGRAGAGLVALRCPGPVLPVRTSGIEQRSGWRIPWRRRALVRIGPPIDLSACAGPSDRRAALGASAALIEAIRRL